MVRSSWSVNSVLGYYSSVDNKSREKYRTRDRQTGRFQFYDEAGNLTRDFNGHTFSYDAENHLTTYDNGAAVYSYDGDGRKVKKEVGNAKTVFVYDITGKLVAEYDNAAAPDSGGTSHLTSDHLGTPRVITDQNGAVKARHDYLPFGEEIAIGVGGRKGQTDPATGGVGQKYIHGAGNDSVRQKFTGYARNAETGLDYAVTRHYASDAGRFTSTDLIFIDQSKGNPQSWNLYTYVGNRPLTYTDPLGLWKQVPCSSGKNMCWEAEKGDSIFSLAEKLHLGQGLLNNFFGNLRVSEGQVYDISGFFHTNSHVEAYKNTYIQIIIWRPTKAEATSIFLDMSRISLTIACRHGKEVGGKLIRTIRTTYDVTPGEKAGATCSPTTTIRTGQRNWPKKSWPSRATVTVRYPAGGPTA